MPAVDSLARPDVLLAVIALGLAVAAAGHAALLPTQSAAPAGLVVAFVATVDGLARPPTE
ncbi:hypothetical protein [Halobaculum sp. MBLA0143]|uniref:hypothetical protein n=1 Tax=Halobaculum sp. MBLA0143 TaxID=3079933 RepID=UPI003526012B